MLRGGMRFGSQPMARGMGALGRPGWIWSFLGGTIPSGATFTRGSAGSYFNSSGVLTSASSNVPRFDYDPATLAPLGYLTEMQSTNLILRSNEMANAAWTQYNAVATAAATTAPDGTAAGVLIKEDTATNAHAVYQHLSGLTANEWRGVSFFAKAKERTAVYFTYVGTSNEFARVVFDLQGGVVTDQNVGSTSGGIASVGIRPVGGGWYRCWAVVRANTTSVDLEIGLANAASGNPANAAGEVVYLGDNTSGAYFWGAQVDTAGIGVTSLIPTAGSTVTRAQDFLSAPLSSVPGFSATKGGVWVSAFRLHTGMETADNYLGRLTDGTTSNEIALRAAFVGADVRWGPSMTSGGASQFVLSGGSQPANFVRRKAAAGWGTSRAVIAADGAAVTSSSGSYTLPVGLTTWEIGERGSQNLQGTLESIAYYPGQRSDAFVQAVSR